MLGRLRITRWWVGIRVCRCPLRPNGRIRRQRHGAVVVLLGRLRTTRWDAWFMNYIVIELVLLVINLFCLMICVMNYIVINLFCLSWTILCIWMNTYSTYFGGSPAEEATKIDNGKKQNNYIYWLTDEYNGSHISRGSPPGSNIFVG
jgi:hypothetical protein